MAAVERTRARPGTARDTLEQIEHVVAELRSRGDTLVRREDLRTVLRHVDPLGLDSTLEGALGGSPPNSR